MRRDPVCTASAASDTPAALAAAATENDPQVSDRSGLLAGHGAAVHLRWTLRGAR